VSEELLTIAEPKSRPDLIHSYALSTESIHGAAYGHNLSAKHIISILEKSVEVAVACLLLLFQLLIVTSLTNYCLLGECLKYIYIQV
jgi:hypothetical protein